MKISNRVSVEAYFEKNCSSCWTPAPSSILPGAVDMGVPEVYEYNEVLINRTQVRNPDYRPPTPIRVENELVDYNHDPIEGTFMVTIKLPV
ncbi:hypothetical protein FOB64_000345 [Candida albicans]|uniref:Uncharacterized protein n=1 Tax=Candida albicans TaxID=5476 RepID=A0A8H6F6Y4_CANAX|nr:hypothetical protein FOB64_000345 [Candida albicans]